MPFFFYTKRLFSASKVPRGGLLHHSTAFDKNVCDLSHMVPYVYKNYSRSGGSIVPIGYLGLIREFWDFLQKCTFVHIWSHMTQHSGPKLLYGQSAKGGNLDHGCTNKNNMCNVTPLAPHL